MGGYIGNEPTTGHFPVDNFTSSGGSTYTLSKTPGSAGAIEVRRVGAAWGAPGRAVASGAELGARTAALGRRGASWGGVERGRAGWGELWRAQPR